jgi:hypothetical protein
MKETDRKTPGAGKQKKPARRNKSTDAGASGDGALGLETNLYTCKRLLESGSVERAILQNAQGAIGSASAKGE